MCFTLKVKPPCPILAGDLPESKLRGVLGGGQTGEQQASSRVTPPEPEGVERQKPEQGLTPHITGGKKQSEERAALFAVRVHVIVRCFLVLPLLS